MIKLLITVLIINILYLKNFNLKDLSLNWIKDVLKIINKSQDEEEVFSQNDVDNILNASKDELMNKKIFTKDDINNVLNNSKDELKNKKIFSKKDICDILNNSKAELTNKKIVTQNNIKDELIHKKIVIQHDINNNLTKPVFIERVPNDKIKNVNTKFILKNKLIDDKNSSNKILYLSIILILIIVYYIYISKKIKLFSNSYEKIKKYINKILEKKILENTNQNDELTLENDNLKI